MRMLPLGEFAARVVPYLHAAGLVSGADVRGLSPHEEATLALAAPLVQTRMTLLGEAPGMLGFLFVADGALRVEEEALAKLPENAAEVLDAAIAVIEGLTDFSPEAQQAALTAVLVEQMGIKPRFAFGPLRVAITGRQVSPPLFESMEILGQDHALARLRALRSRLG
jgi:glutamyl-tRNA synthetase